MESVFAHPLMARRRVREQRQHQRGRKLALAPRVYSLHAPDSGVAEQFSHLLTLKIPQFS